MIKRKGFSVAEALVSLLVFSVILGMCAPLFSKRTQVPSLDMAGSGVPSGVILMWSGAVNNIPAGFALCDGQNGTPDLRGKFVVGYDSRDNDYNTIGNTDGNKENTLTEDDWPAHYHFMAVDATVSKVALSSSNNFMASYGKTAGDYEWYTLQGLAEGTPTLGRTSSAGNGEGDLVLENRPPYYTLAYIMKL